ncbi:hypothetical protein CYMTET_50675 [Cymbomonas tetramitiformis]|uniref:Uncharacterized protein n=1 Tax=Cymbomonas tetramitiformis TaxID=36881 RepID=A0AAE0BMJ3_9CHLO|nr:hypothetical protein CYMTET_50675 [Cymbomonas tetramitiformis]
MLKGIPADPLFSGQVSQNEGLWLEFRAKITPSCRHPCLAILSTETCDIDEIQGRPLPHFGLVAGELPGDFGNTSETDCFSDFSHSGSDSSDPAPNPEEASDSSSDDEDDLSGGPRGSDDASPYRPRVEPGN